MLEKSIKNFNWRKTLEYLSIRFKFDLLNETLKYFRNYIPNEKKEMRLLPVSMNDCSIKRSLTEHFKNY